MRNKIIFIIIIIISALCKAETEESNRYFTFNSEPYSYMDIDSIPKFNYKGYGAIEYINQNLQISDSVKYRPKAVIMVIIQKNGMVGNIIIWNNIPQEIKEKIVRVIKSMPKWSPGILNNNPVDVRLYFTIKY